jgi:glycosyltransferase involved in cell wall biosynthesis
MPKTSLNKNNQKPLLISIIVPAFNEAKNLPHLLEEIKTAFAPLPYHYEVLLINDGSTDTTLEVAKDLEKANPHTVKVIDFSRNFGKEAATTAGYRHATGDAVMAIDADLQHPPVLIPQFIEKWQAGSDVVIGVRSNNASDSFLKKLGSKLYYKIINRISETPIVPNATDFRLLDRQVVDELNTMTEHNRMTRGLIDWLGFRRDYIYFTAPERLHGEASYSFWKLVKLAAESFIAHSLLPLRLAGYVGIGIMTLSGLLGMLMVFDRYINSMGLNFSGPAILANIILFLVGIVLIMLGLLSYYIGQMYHDAQNRPLYVVRNSRE